MRHVWKRIVHEAFFEQHFLNLSTTDIEQDHSLS